jgi:UDP-N-acetylmuramoyl-L-alanyl-D-glutamate--2,6-diaminopimelate ligase
MTLNACHAAQLHELLKSGGALFDEASMPSVPVSAVVCDSRKAVPGSIFVAIKGSGGDGHPFAAQAIRAGALAIVTQDPNFRSSVPVAVVANARLAYARFNHLLHGEPSARMKMLAVTGTNGKTTSAYLAAHLLKRKMRPILLGTIEYRFEAEILPSTHTTPDPDVLHPWLAQMALKGADSVVLEASSHALEQERLAGIDFDGALFTNLTQDHLDYHGTLDAYLAAKLKLFAMIRPGGIAIVNADDPAALQVCAAVPADKKCITYGRTPNADIRAEAIRSDLKGSEFVVRYEGREFVVKTQLLGLHNVYNALGALGLAMAAGMPLEESIPGLANFKGVSGRLERVPCEQGFELFIDYAHTPDGIQNVLSAVRPYAHKRLLVLFGCGGDRDRTKRPKMAAAVEAAADRIVLTSDNPRSENPRQIILEIQAGFSDGNKNVDVQPDRAKAIRQILLEARPGDVVLLLGKGHEEYQIIGTEKIPFSDREEALKALKGR